MHIGLDPSILRMKVNPPTWLSSTAMLDFHTNNYLWWFWYLRSMYLFMLELIYIYIYICYKYANRYISLSVYSLKRLFWVIFTKHILLIFIIIYLFIKKPQINSRKISRYAHICNIRLKSTKSNNFRDHSECNLQK